jgi:hypothetical protein
MWKTILVLGAATALSSSAAADSCVNLQGITLINNCDTCLEIVIQQLHAPGTQVAGRSTNEPRVLRLQAGSQTSLQEGERSAIADIRKCN